MKRLLVLTVISCFLVATAGVGFAAELSSYGYFRTTLAWQNNQFFGDDYGSEEVFAAEQRLRQFFEYKSSENLKAVVGFEFDSVWGDNYGIVGDQNKGFQSEPFYTMNNQVDEGGALELKHAYVDFTLPNTQVNFKIGGQYMALPGIKYTSPILGCDAPGIQMNAPINDKVALNLGWVRAMEDFASDIFYGENEWGVYNGTDVSEHNTGDGSRSYEADMFFATTPIDMDDISFTPYAAYAYVGEEAMSDSSITAYGDSFNTVGNGLRGFSVMSMGTWAGETYEDSVDAYWLGFHTQLDNIENMSIQAEGAYGSVEASKDANDRSGYWFRGLADYTALDYVTPSLFGFYSSGDDDDLTDGSETFPYFANDGYTVTETGYISGFGSNTNFGSYDYALMQYVPHAMWQLGLAAKDFSFMEKCSHTLAVSYMRGTNDDALVDQVGTGYPFNGEMTTEDQAWEIDFNTTYSIYENLDALMEVGYAKMDMDEDTWGDNYLNNGAVKFVTGVKYSY